MFLVDPRTTTLKNFLLIMTTVPPTASMEQDEKHTELSEHQEHQAAALGSAPRAAEAVSAYADWSKRTAATRFWKVSMYAALAGFGE